MQYLKMTPVLGDFVQHAEVAIMSIGFILHILLTQKLKEFTSGSMMLWGASETVAGGEGGLICSAGVLVCSASVTGSSLKS